MTTIPAIALTTLTRSRAKPSSPKPPVEYGAVLIEHRIALGLTREELAELAGVDYNTVLRNEKGMPARSVKGASALRAALIARGREVPPVPVGVEDWLPPVVVSSGPKLDPADETVRRNLVRFREAVGLDIHAAAFASKVPLDELREYELGDRLPSTQILSRLANAYGCTAGAFLDATDELPRFDVERQVAIHFGGPGTRLLTDAEREDIAKITASVTARDRAEKQAIAAAAKAKKRR